MADLDLAALAREREARRGGPPPAATPPLPRSWAASRAPAPAASAGALLSFHRSIRLARSIGLAATVLTALLIVLGAGWRAIIITLLVAVGFARGGARLLHGLLPPTLIESGAKPPTDAEMAAAAGAGLFCVDGIKTFGDSLAAEYALALDSLAFVCTYGKKNCLTNEMCGTLWPRRVALASPHHPRPVRPLAARRYSGPMSLGKIAGLVWGKLREGVVRC